MFAKSANPLFTRVFGFFSFCAAFNAVPENLLLFLCLFALAFVVYCFETSPYLGGFTQNIKSCTGSRLYNTSSKLFFDCTPYIYMQQSSIITEFDEVLWYTLVDRITVYNETDIRFIFKNGTECKVYEHKTNSSLPLYGGEEFSIYSINWNLSNTFVVSCLLQYKLMHYEYKHKKYELTYGQERNRYVFRNNSE